MAKRPDIESELSRDLIRSRTFWLDKLDEEGKQVAIRARIWFRGHHGEPGVSPTSVYSWLVRKLGLKTDKQKVLDWLREPPNG